MGQSLQMLALGLKSIFREQCSLTQRIKAYMAIFWEGQSSGQLSLCCALSSELEVCQKILWN